MTRIELAKKFKEEADTNGYDMKLELVIRGRFANVFVSVSPADFDL